MRTTITLDDELLSQASEAMGTTERSTLLHEGLRLIVQRESSCLPLSGMLTRPQSGGQAASSCCRVKPQ